MKNHVIREWTGKFNEAVITIDDVSEWTAIHTGINSLIKQYKESLEFYTRLLKDAESDEDKTRYENSIKEDEDYLSMLENMSKSLDVKNEIPITKYNIKKEKVDYEFDCNIEDFTDEEILNKLNNIFPEKKLYMIPHFRGKIVERLTVLGHNGNIIVIYKKNNN